MQPKEFIDILSMTYGWRLTSQNKLRAEDGSGRCFCPVTYVAMKLTGTFYELHDFQDAADAIGLDLREAKKIVLAADGQGHEADRDLLRKITRVA